MSGEWKDLDFGNVPSDIFTGDYEFLYGEGDVTQNLFLIHHLGCGACYRKRQTEEHSNEELLRHELDEICKEVNWRPDLNLINLRSAVVLLLQVAINRESKGKDNED